MSDEKKGGEPEDLCAKYKVSARERAGLTSGEAEAAHNLYGYNELPVVEVSKLMLLLSQFTGTMPYMLETALLVAAITQDFPDVAIIAFMLLANGILGFREELECLHSLEELTKKMEAKVTVQRDGVGVHLNTRELVPGDVIMLLGGLQVPADVDWIEGDQVMVDTAALTGEGVARKYPSEDYGQSILCGATIQSGEAYAIVRKIGLETEIGGMTAKIQEDKAGGKVFSVFERRVLQAVQIVIGVSLVITLTIFIQQGVALHEFEGAAFKKDLLTCLSIIVAAIPIALPIVLNVTMSLGAAKMATEFHAVVTNLPALQDIASMSVLCSDKTGTLTTAKMTINADMVWCVDGYTQKDVGLYAMLASSRDKKEDAVDRTVVKHFDTVFGGDGQKLIDEYTKTGGMGFNPIYKRVVVQLKHPQLGTVKIGKGLATKVMDTADGGVDEAEEQWKCDNYDTLMPLVRKKDKQLSTAGYKTLGVAVKISNEPWRFVGILPMMDPPRHDSAKTVQNLKDAGVRVKMITGDHLNIAIETCRQIKMGVNLFPGTDVRTGTEVSKQKIDAADGFAQVLPSDKREVVEVLKKHFGYVVGMTGDGVNDAPALSAAQCGVAVDDATDAAKNAAAIILNAPGLSAIYMAVVESRRIFRKLKSYVTYRFAASIQIVICLSVLVFTTNCTINPTYIVLLALLNDLTMLPIAYDVQAASSKPENPDVFRILVSSLTLGFIETLFTLLFAFSAGPSKMFKSPLSMSACANTEIDPDNASASSKTIQAAIWLQMFIAAEILIFSARATTYFWNYLLPSPWLVFSVLGGCIGVSALCNIFDYFGALNAGDVVFIWLYNILVLVVVDCVKVKLFEILDENSETIPEETVEEAAHVKALGQVYEVHDEDIAAMNEELPEEGQLSMKSGASVHRMTSRSIIGRDDFAGLDTRARKETVARIRGTALSRTTSFAGGMSDVGSFKEKEMSAMSGGSSLGRHMSFSRNQPPLRESLLDDDSAQGVNSRKSRTSSVAVDTGSGLVMPRSLHKSGQSLGRSQSYLSDLRGTVLNSGVSLRPNIPSKRF